MSLYRKMGEYRVDTGRQWAEVNFVPNWLGDSKKSLEYRFIATREPLNVQPLPGGIVGAAVPHHDDVR